MPSFAADPMSTGHTVLLAEPVGAPQPDKEEITWKGDFDQGPDSWEADSTGHWNDDNQTAQTDQPSA